MSKKLKSEATVAPWEPTAFQYSAPSASFRRPTWNPALDIESRYAMTNILLQLHKLATYQHPKLADQLSNISQLQALVEGLHGFHIQVSNLDELEAELESELHNSAALKPDWEPGCFDLKSGVKAEGGPLKDTSKVEEIKTEKDAELKVIVVLAVEDEAYWARYPGRFGILIFPDDFEYKPWEVKNCVVGHEMSFWATCTHCYALANGTCEGIPK